MSSLSCYLCCRAFLDIVVFAGGILQEDNIEKIA